MFNEIVKEIIVYIIGISIPVIFGWMGAQAKKLWTKYANNKTKEDVAKIVVKATEQVWKAIHGPEKRAKALGMAATLLQKKGIDFDAAEMEILIEAALAEFNDAFNSTPSIMKGIAVEDLDDDQLRSLLQQCGFAYTENMTREEMLAALDELDAAAAQA